MHCPGCGQQQISSETKFCSRCGMPLGIVSEVLAHGGFLPQLAQLNKKKTVFNKKNGVVFGAFWFIFFSMFCTAFFGILGAPEELVGILAITGVFGTMMIIIFSLIFLPSSKISMANLAHFQTTPQPDRFGLPAQQQNQALPPQQSIPASVYAPPQAGNWRDTNDLQPTSVTEGTTKLLDKDEI
jgi:uncharacterized protein with PQ loop repeat